MALKQTTISLDIRIVKKLDEDAEKTKHSRNKIINFILLEHYKLK